MTTSAGARVAVVTGATGGIGSAVCRRLAADGFAVACLDIDEADVKRQAADLPEAIGVAVDVRDAASVRAAGTRIRAELGAAWLLVNVAGVFSIQRITELAEAEWDRILDTNLKGPYLTCREFLPDMIDAHDGCVVNVASTAGVRGGRRRAAYCASKGGLVQLTRSLAIDHGPDGVRVNCVCPGLIDTSMADWIRLDEEALTQWAGTIPARRIGTAAEIADTIAFLASPGGSYVQGAVLMVDGGVTA
ncbi:MAG TPA: SDR family NAD(P)-dependent oxidoreductase [Streptosporangiaceae bacterium]|jgi:NAD(P)-dependent dehydrogenase (short-subunit alcohol dehydrogenase family)|nr:SDR family NAD(P)-dependent oxidoreductase [Streptosporangiaceae bacterium]